MAGLHSTESTPQLYALQTHAPEMYPRFKVGEIAIIDKNDSVQPGDDVIVTFNDGSWTVRTLVTADDATVTLKTEVPSIFRLPSSEFHAASFS